MRRDSSSPLPLELALIESAAEPAPVVAAAEPAYRQQTARRAPASRAAPAPSSLSGGRPSPSAPGRPAPQRAAVDQTPPSLDARADPNWNNLLRSLRNAGARFKIGALLRSARGYELDADAKRMTVKFAHSSHIDRIRGEIDNPAVGRQVREAISETMNGDYEIVLELANGGGASPGQPKQSRLVRAAQAMGARLIDKYEETAQT